MKSSDGDLIECPCCKECKDCTGFQKVVDVKNAGLVIYRHKARTENVNKDTGIAEFATQMPEDVFILHNTKDIELTPADYLPEIEQNKINCPRCLRIIEHAQKLLQKVPTINRNDVQGICEHCRTTLREAPCFECEEIVKKFVSPKSKRTENEKQRFKQWLTKIKHLMKDVVVDTETGNERIRAHSEIYIDQLCRESSDHGRKIDVRKMFQPESEGFYFTKAFPPSIKKRNEIFAHPLQFEKFESPSKEGINFAGRDKAYVSIADRDILPQTPLPTEKHKKEKHVELIENIPPVLFHSEQDIIGRDESSTQPKQILRPTLPESFYTLDEEPDVKRYIKSDKARTFDKETRPADFVSIRRHVASKTDGRAEFVSHKKTSISPYIIRKNKSDKPLMTTVVGDTRDTIDHDFRYVFPKMLSPEPEKLQRKISSSELIKDIQDMLRSKQEKKSLEEERKKELDEEKKKRIALEQRKKQLDAERKLGEKKMRLDALEKPKLERKISMEKKKMAKTEKVTPTASTANSEINIKESSSAWEKMESKPVETKDLKGLKESIESKRSRKPKELQGLMELKESKRLKAPRELKVSEEIKVSKELKKPKEYNELKEPMESKTPNESKKPKAQKASKEPTGLQEAKRPRDPKESKVLNESKETKEQKLKELLVPNRPREPKEPQELKEPKVLKELKESKSPHESNETKEQKSSKVAREPKSIKALQESERPRELKEFKERKESKAPKVIKQLSAPIESKEPREPKSSKALQESKKSREAKDSKERNKTEERKKFIATRSPKESKTSKKPKEFVSFLEPTEPKGSVDLKQSKERKVSKTSNEPTDRKVDEGSLKTKKEEREKDIELVKEKEEKEKLKKEKEEQLLYEKQMKQIVQDLNKKDKGELLREKKEDKFVSIKSENNAKQGDETKKVEKERIDIQAKEEARLKLKLAKGDEAKREHEESKAVKRAEHTNIKDIKAIKVRAVSYDDLILRLVRIKQSTLKEILRPHSETLSRSMLSARNKRKKGRRHKTAPASILRNSDLELDAAEALYLKEPKVENLDIIIGQNIYKFKPSLKEKKIDLNVVPLIFQTKFNQTKEVTKRPPEAEKIPPVITTGKQAQKTYIDQEATKGVIRYALSDRSFIDKGWTMLPTEKVVRKMNVYRMRPAQPEFDWFEHNKNKRLMTYDTGEKLAEFDDNGRKRCRWFYKNGRMALDYYDAEELNANQRFVVYSSGEPDERGRTYPYMLLATFDYLGNGIVYDHNGKVRLKYNQTEGIVLDRSIGPESHWKWHTLNDPPVLQQVMIDTQMAHKDPAILKLGGPDDITTRPENEDMLAIEFDNFIKEKSKKLSQSFKPFQIKMKALKINENFSLKVLDQATVYLIFRDGTTNLKLNIGMVLDHKEIVDTDTAELGEVSNNMERFPARTNSLAGLHRNIAHAQHLGRIRTERERKLRPPAPCGSADKLTAAASRPLHFPLRTGPSGSTTNCFCK